MRGRVETECHEENFIFKIFISWDVTQRRPLCNIQEERRSRLNRGGSLKSCPFFVFQTCHACIGALLTKRSVSCITLNRWDFTSTLLQDVSMGNNNMAVVLLRNVDLNRITTSVHLFLFLVQTIRTSLTELGMNNINGIRLKTSTSAVDYYLLHGAESFLRS